MVFSLNVSNAIHKARHAIGGADPITPADIGAEVAGAGAGLIAAERVTERANQSATYLPRTAVIPSSLFTAGLTAYAENAPAPLTTPTYDGTGQAVHPSVLQIPGGFGGYEFWMCMTPYAGSNNTLENPSILASHDGYTWVVPPGLTNPIYSRPTGTGSDFNSDPFLVRADGYLYCFFRSYQQAQIGTEERLYFSRSLDGVIWEPAVLSMSNPASRPILAPSYLADTARGLWFCWGVDSTGANRVIRWQATNPVGPWTDETVTTGIAFAGTKEPWHVDIHRFGGEYVALALATVSGLGTVAGSELRRFTSLDGLDWTPDALPIMDGLMSAWDANLYKAALLPATVLGTPGYRMWYSALLGVTWRIGHTTVTLTPPNLDTSMREALSGVNSDMADNFNRADSVTTPGNLSTGQMWNVVNGPGGIQTNRFYSTAGLTSLWVDNGTADTEVGVTLAVTGGEYWVVARRLNSSNYVRFGTTGTVWEVQKAIAGVITSLRTTTRPYTAGDRIRLSVIGTTIRCYLNGRLIMRETATVLAVGTGVGITTHTTARLDNFYARPATN